MPIVEQLIEPEVLMAKPGIPIRAPKRKEEPDILNPIRRSTPVPETAPVRQPVGPVKIPQSPVPARR